MSKFTHKPKLLCVCQRDINNKLLFTLTGGFPLAVLACFCNFVTEQASAVMQEVTEWALQLRYRTTAARILDAHRKFLDASVRFYELSLAQVCVCVYACFL